MTATIEYSSRLSKLTLAMLEATGWYEVDYSMADQFYWGEGKGCSFVTGPCYDSDL